jgi:flagellar basal-body rod modification protein FlgD
MLNTLQDNNAASSLFGAMNAGASAGNKSSSVADTQNRFLKLLVTQLKNQDPLNPMDNAQITSQMAQLSTVTGIDKLNVTLQALSDSMTSNQSLQAASMIGHGVLIEGSGIDLNNGAGLGGFELPHAVEHATVSIYDKSGALVNTLDLGALPAGISKWQWDGTDSTGATVADGEYTFAVNASQAGVNVAATNLQFGVVNSVNQGSNGVLLSVGTMEGIALSQIKQIL